MLIDFPEREITMSQNPITILLVDDDDVDVRIVKRALSREKINNPLVVARDGVEALELLRGDDAKPALEQPLLILLDLNMPRMGGLEFLQELRSDRRLAKSIVFVLTTSNDERDRHAAYSCNVAGYLLKSEAGRDLMNHFPLFERYLMSVQFPGESGENDSHRELCSSDG